MPTIKRLPGPADGVQGLLDLADTFGPRQVFELIRLCRLDNGPGARPAAEVSTEMAKRMVADYMRDKNVDRDVARREVALSLGYTQQPNTVTNFYKILDGIARRSLGRKAAK